VVTQSQLVASNEQGWIQCNLCVGTVLGEVPHGVDVGHGGCVLVAPDELLDWVVEVEADQLGAGLVDYGDGVTAGVLELLNQVLAVGCSECGALGSVEVHVVGPDLEGGQVEVVGEVGG